MNAHLILLRLDVRLIACGLTLLLPLFANATDCPPETMVQVTVFPDYYAVNKQRLGDVVALEASLGPTNERVVRLEKCGPAATQALVAAIATLNVVHNGVIEIHALPVVDPKCSRSQGERIFMP
ncbi:MAG: hypothetical protein JNM42_12270 [Propionivibrio sp.]|uniref:hypothetical protein n=1 Tax=Propionivibrio sp. TaxID=2212460 RepID=UPI001A42D96D|nr:hypothetical protein [Propionivibrio sp.]MBL8415203.1 hypothetical protein [Propionivibrio sp.]